MATTPLPEQEQQQPTIYSQAVPNGAWHSSGSVGPFFAVMSVLMVLTVLSCVLACAYARRSVGPLNISYGDCLCCVRWRWRWRWRWPCCSISNDPEVGEVNVECNNIKSQGSEIPPHPPPP